MCKVSKILYAAISFFKKSASVLHGRRRKRNGVMAEIQSTFVIFMLCSTGLAQTQKTATHKDILTKIVVVNIISATMTQMSTLGKWWFLREKCKKCPKERFFFLGFLPPKWYPFRRHSLAQKPLKLIIYIKCIGRFVPKLFKQCKQ